MLGDVLAGKTALITAAGQGIGREIAISMAASGANVIATDAVGHLLDGLADVQRMSTRMVDVTDGPAIAKLRDEVGGIDVLVNVAGIVHQGTILDCEEDQWDRSFDVNVKGMYRTIRAFLPGMIERGGGSIINISSVASSVMGVPNRCAYGATKAAVIGLTKAVAADFAGANIRCNAICPGTIETPSLRERIEHAPDPAAARRKFVDRHPVGRLGKPSEIAAGCVYLASDFAQFTTGTELIIDGAMSL